MAEHTTGEDSRFRDVFFQHYKRVFSFFMRHGFPFDDAKDMTQETFLRIHRGMENYRGGSSWSFVRRTANNIRINAIRDGHAKGRGAVKEHVDDWDALPASVQRNPVIGTEPTTPEDELLKNELAALLLAEIEKLPKRMRRALLMQAYKGLSYREIGLAMGTSSEAVKALLRRTRKKLKKRLSSRIKG